MAIESTNYINGSQPTYQPALANSDTAKMAVLPKAQMNGGAQPQVALEQGIVELTKAITQLVMQISQFIQAFLKQMSGQSAAQDASAAAQGADAAGAAQGAQTSATDASGGGAASGTQATSSTTAGTAAEQTKQNDTISQFIEKVGKFVTDFNEKFGTIVAEIGTAVIGGAKIKAAIKGIQKLFKGLGKIKSVKSFANKVKNTFKKLF